MSVWFLIPYYVYLFQVCLYVHLSHILIHYVTDSWAVSSLNWLKLRRPQLVSQRLDLVVLPSHFLVLTLLFHDRLSQYTVDVNRRNFQLRGGHLSCMAGTCHSQSAYQILLELHNCTCFSVPLYKYPYLLTYLLIGKCRNNIPNFHGFGAVKPKHLHHRSKSWRWEGDQQLDPCCQISLLSVKKCVFRAPKPSTFGTNLPTKFWVNKTESRLPCGQFYRQKQNWK